MNVLEGLFQVLVLGVGAHTCHPSLRTLGQKNGYSRVLRIVCLSFFLRYPLLSLSPDSFYKYIVTLICHLPCSLNPHPPSGESLCCPFFLFGGLMSLIRTVCAARGLELFFGTWWPSSVVYRTRQHLFFSQNLRVAKSLVRRAGP